MPAKQRSSQSQPAVVSDYDTDTPAPAPASLPTRQWTLDSLNEEVLRMYLPDLEYIDTVAPFTVIYLFSPESQQWEKSGCEGTLFLCKMPGSRYSVVVLNRKSLDNFVMEITSSDDVEITNEYIILQKTNDNGVPQIYGLWVYNDDGKSLSTKDDLGIAIQKAAMRAQLAIEAEAEEEQEQEQQACLNYEQVTPGIPTQPGQPLDISKLFSKPQIQQETHTSPILPTNSRKGSGQQLDLLKLFGKAQGNGQGRQHQPVATLFSA